MQTSKPKLNKETKKLNEPSQYPQFILILVNNNKKIVHLK